jgi:malate synthase
MTNASTNKSTAQVQGLQILAPVRPDQEEILSTAALEFLADLERRFGARRRELLDRRTQRQQDLDAGGSLDFLTETREVRSGEWRVAPVPAEILDRRVEITGPTDRKMVINALNSGANVFMADCEDSLSPTWDNVVEGQRNLRDAVLGTIELTDEARGKHYRLAEQTAVLFVRPRGWHLDEKNVLVDGERMSGSMFDFGLYFFHCAKERITSGSAPYFYLPKLESHLEARLWNDVFVYAQERLGIPVGTIKATVLIETITAAFEMDEILYELRDHSAGLNCGRWDYIFSFIKRFRAHADRVLPDRGQVGMTQHFLRSYSQLLIKTCHRRGAFAMGGMAAQIPIKSDENRNKEAMDKVHADKKREAEDGHDGTWVAHPGLVAIAKAEFDAVLAPSRQNQLDITRDDVNVGTGDLLAMPLGTRTELGLRQNLDVGMRYLEAWLCGNGCVPLYDLMEDAATAEISRVQVWQWVRYQAALDDGRQVDRALVRAVLEDLVTSLRNELGESWGNRRFDLAAQLFEEMVFADELPEFLTSIAYEHIE